MKTPILISAVIIVLLTMPEESWERTQVPVQNEGQVKEDKAVDGVDPTILQESMKASKDIKSASSKGLEYYLVNYGPLAKIFVEDFMDSFGLAKNLQLAIPILAKMMLIGVLAGMQFKPSLQEFQQTARSAYVFLQNFDRPEVKVMNDITDKVYEVLEKELFIK